MPTDYVAVIPKYAPNQPPGPWRISTVSYGRVLSEYNAASTRAASKRVGLKLWYDPLYGAEMPLLPRHQAYYVCDPIEALWERLRSPRNLLDHILLRVVVELERGGVDPNSLGLTGTLAIGMEAVGVSDIDLVVYGEEAVENMVKIFNRIGAPTEPGKRASSGGVRVWPPISVDWRRRIFEGVAISWIGAPWTAGEHCKPLEEWRRIAPPRGFIRTRVKVRAGQASALLYPPCVTTEGGAYIVAYVYNLARRLYQGGVLEIEGIITDAGDIIVGTQENPGLLLRVA